MNLEDNYIYKKKEVLVKRLLFWEKLGLILLIAIYINMYYDIICSQ